MVSSGLWRRERKPIYSAKTSSQPDARIVTDLSFEAGLPDRMSRCVRNDLPLSSLEARSCKTLRPRGQKRAI